MLVLIVEDQQYNFNLKQTYSLPHSHFIATLNILILLSLIMDSIIIMGSITVGIIVKMTLLLDLMKEEIFF